MYKNITKLVLIRRLLKMSIYLNLILTANMINATEVLSWSELDKQELDYVKNIYSGHYSKVIGDSQFSGERNEMIKKFHQALILDVHFLRRYCLNSCGHCYLCPRVKYFGIPDVFEFKRKKSTELYKEAIKLGHPYAGYLFARHYLFSFNKMRRKDAFKNLLPYVNNNDGVATFMYHELKGDLAISRDSASWSRDRKKKIIEETIKLLEQEAIDGRILSMYYLGITYQLQEDNVKAVAWFTAGAKHGHWLSSQYIEECQERIIASKRETEAINYISKVLNYFTSSVRI